MYLYLQVKLKDNILSSFTIIPLYSTKSRLLLHTPYDLKIRIVSIGSFVVKMKNQKRLFSGFQFSLTCHVFNLVWMHMDKYAEMDFVDKNQRKTRLFYALRSGHKLWLTIQCPTENSSKL